MKKRFAGLVLILFLLLTVFQAYGETNAMNASGVRAFTEDDRGVIYAATTSGIGNIHKAQQEEAKGGSNENKE